MRNSSTYRVVYKSVRQQIKEAMQQFPNLVNSNNRDFSIIFSDAPDIKFSFTINERFPETSPKILLNGLDSPTSLTSFWQPTITISQIVNYLHLIALAKNSNYSSGMSQNISFKANLNSSMPPRFTQNHPDFNPMTDPNENEDEKAKHKNSRNENETKSEVDDDDEIDLDNIDVDDNSASEDPQTELMNSSEDISDNKYSSIRSGHRSNQNSKQKGSNRNQNKSNKDESFGEEEEEVDIEINMQEINNEEGDENRGQLATKKNRKFKLKPNANGAAIQNRDIFLDIQELDAVVTESDEQRQKENEFEQEFEDEDNNGEEEEEEEIYEDNPTFDKMIRKLGYLYLKKNIDTIAYIQQYKELKKLVPKEADENDF